MSSFRDNWKKIIGQVKKKLEAFKWGGGLMWHHCRKFVAVQYLYWYNWLSIQLQDHSHLIILIFLATLLQGNSQSCKTYCTCLLHYCPCEQAQACLRTGDVGPPGVLRPRHGGPDAVAGAANTSWQCHQWQHATHGRSQAMFRCQMLHKYIRFTNKRIDLKHTTLGREPVSIIYYIRPRSSI